MPLDATVHHDQPAPSPRPATLDRAEREAAALFGPRLREALAAAPQDGRPLVVLARFGAGPEQAEFRLARTAARHPGEAVVAALPGGPPQAGARQRAAAARLTAAAAGAWRQRCQLRRLGLTPAG